MSIAVVSGAHVAAAGLAGATSASIDTTGANFIGAAVAYDNSSVSPVFSDSKSNTWQALTVQTGGAHKTVIFYAYNPTVGGSHTFTHNGVAVAFSVQGFSGVKTSADPFDTQQGATTTSTQAGCGSANLVPSEDNELILLAVGINGGVTNFAGAAGFTVTDFTNFAGGSNYGCGLLYLIQTTAATIDNSTPLASWTTSSPIGEATATFKVGPAGVAAVGSLFGALIVYELPIGGGLIMA